MSTPTERTPMTPAERAQKKAAKKQRQKDNKKKNHSEYRDGVVPNKKPRASAPWASPTTSPQFSDVVVTQKQEPEK